MMERMSTKIPPTSWSSQNRQDTQGGQRLIRLGTTAGPATREKTYRVYVEELPVGDGKTRGSGVSFALKIGVPLFVNPLKSEDRGAVGLSRCREESSLSV
jgi:P pilus assembly chaperone PapD